MANSITIVAKTEQEVSRFKVALLTLPAPIDRVTFDVEAGLASTDLPDGYDEDRLSRALEAKGLKRYVPDFEGEARGIFQQFVDGICGGRKG